MRKIKITDVTLNREGELLHIRGTYDDEQPNNLWAELELRQIL